MTSWQSGDIKVNKLTLHYTRTGGDKPPIVLAHGFSDDGLCWTPVAKLLEADYDVIMVDARGHGKSAMPARGGGRSGLAGDLAGVITGLGLKKPAVLGHSAAGLPAGSRWGDPRRRRQDPARSPRPSNGPTLRAS